jgi:hypothetical protein
VKGATQLVAHLLDGYDYNGQHHRVASDRMGLGTSFTNWLVGGSPRNSRFYKRHAKHIGPAKKVAEQVKFSHPVRFTRSDLDDPALRHKIKEAITQAKQTYLNGFDETALWAIAKLAFFAYHLPDEDEQFWAKETIGVSY